MCPLYIIYNLIFFIRSQIDQQISNMAVFTSLIRPDYKFQFSEFEIPSIAVIYNNPCLQ